MSGSSDNRWRGGASRQASQRNSNNRDKTGGQGGAGDNNAAWGASNPPQEQHVPVRGFNTAEVKNVLKETKMSTPYKSHFKDGPAQRSTAWGPKGTVSFRSQHTLDKQ
ncbi:Pc12g05890 [Penicillium rubens Wisconsin 54-1255]|uniref:Pc12g05890 protein n=1 Tax=Penicillium rubens (strain ATCC 28089 / DSM 1075 / NRRL 1951 / Wisconsin 54-1255) TaxID=500485 RepID=B6GZQ4_PENRW|nr:Pc12g05890 [Penicillium rubens Wisconsin 54-1255]